MKNTILIISAISLLCGCTHLGNKPVDQHMATSTAKPCSYYGQLKSLLSRSNPYILPKASEQDIDLIETKKGAAGVLLGATMDDVVAVWGNPSGLMINEVMDIWFLNIGACKFGFVDNSLVSISIHSVTLPTAHFKNGISFKSSINDLLAAFGEPIKSMNHKYTFVNEDGYVTEFQFFPDPQIKGEERLSTITIYHPDIGAQFLSFLTSANKK